MSDPPLALYEEVRTILMTHGIPLLGGVLHPGALVWEDLPGVAAVRYVGEPTRGRVPATLPPDWEKQVTRILTDAGFQVARQQWEEDAGLYVTREARP